MTIKTRKLLHPQYMKQFACIGPDCEDSCCIGWRVAIDKVTYQKYRSCSDAQLKEQMDEKVTRNRSNKSDSNYAKIGMNSQGACQFLDEEKLCAIQRKLGEESLSVTCSTYPRVTNDVTNTVEKSLTMSCPAAARLVLLNPDPMEFDQTTEDIDIRNSQGKTLNVADMHTAFKAQRYFWEIRVFTISVLQNRQYALWQRLVILGLFYSKLNQLIATPDIQAIPQLIGSYINMLEDNSMFEELDAIPNQLTIQMQLMKDMADERLFFGSIQSDRYKECFAESLHGIGYVSGANVEDIGERYAAAFETWYQPYMVKYEYILENYLVNHVFKNLFPFSEQKHVFDNYVMLVVHYAMIKMILIGMAGYHKEKFGTEHVIKLLQSFSKVVEHNNAYLKMAFNILKVNEVNSMAYMAILIKN